MSHVLPTGRRLGISMMLALGTSLSALGGSPAFAQQGQAAIPSIHLDIPRQPLSAALQAFSRRTGIQVVYTASIDAGIISPGISGDFDAMTALSRLLSGTGVTFRQSGKGAVVLAKASANITLGPVRVGGTVAHENPTGPGVGYVATSTMAGTKTDTPIMEIPNSIYVVTKQLMQDQQPQNVAQALRYSPGIMAESEGTYGNGSAHGADTGIIQRGFSTSQFVDGLMTNSVSAGETAFLERIEVVNGPASVMYGQTTPGGMLAMSLKKPTDTPLRQVSIGFGNCGRYQATFDISDKITKSGNVRYRIAAIGVTQGTQTNYVDYHRVGVMPSITWDIDKNTSLTLLGMYMYTPGEGVASQYPRIGTLSPGPYGQISRSTFFGEPNWNKMGDKDAMFEYQFKHSFNKYINFSQNFRWENSDRHQETTYVKTGAVKPTIVPLQPMDYYTNTRTIGMDARFFGKFNIESVNNTWVIGSDFRKYNYNSHYLYDYTTTPSVNVDNPSYSYTPCYSWAHAGCQIMGSLYNTQYFQEGVYFQDQIKWKRLSILVGGRQDWVNMKYTGDSTSSNQNVNNVKTTQDYLSTDKPQPQSAFTWRAGIIYNFDFGLAPYFSYATSFIPQIGQTDYQGHPFAPLTGKQMEAGLKYKVPNKDILLTAAAFHIEEDNYLISDLAHTGYSTNAGRVRSQGFELSANANITKDLRLIASYSYTDIRYAKTNKTAKRYDLNTSSSYGTAVSQEGMSVPYVPRNMFSFFVDYTIHFGKLKGFGINFGTRYTGFTYADSVESFKTRPYVLFDAGAHYDFGQAFSVLKGLNAQLAMSNLANTYYETQCSNSVCYLGQGRRVYGNLTYNW
ncbi:iron complex outermembrane receptor protein [Gluconacetobacter liquefaciens]|uniref:Iron complex outermembrane receptor protein n=2 Tax=Gluconacetobacter liquefaciens TaxID=89584 RepID=A0A370G6B7_GLULI|nr:TonB-dependent siderophore receptor [Gluconacetobacter liquefaciens]RDI39335.1 iron complex outermembrane receptor protein [Gluconacetobacter liquefaciens]